jgi:hypothetical protein
MAETFEARRNRILSYPGNEEPIRIQQATQCRSRAQVSGVLRNPRAQVSGVLRNPRGQFIK